MRSLYYYGYYSKYADGYLIRSFVCKNPIDIPKNVIQFFVTNIHEMDLAVWELKNIAQEIAQEYSYKTKQYSKSVSAEPLEVKDFRAKNKSIEQNFPPKGGLTGNYC